MFSLVSRIIYAPNAYTGNRKNLGGTTMLFISYKGLSRSASRTVRRALRLAGQQGVTVEDLMTITAADVQKTRETDDKLNDALKKEQEIIDSTQKLIDELQTGLPKSPEK